MSGLSPTYIHNTHSSDLLLIHRLAEEEEEGDLGLGTPVDPLRQLADELSGYKVNYILIMHRLRLQVE